jgi:hypothetical protein
VIPPRNIVMLTGLTLAWRPALSAQSTAALGRYERPIQIQVSVGANDFETQSGLRLRAASASMEFVSGGERTVRADAWYLDWKGFSSRMTDAALVIGVEFPMRLSHDFSLGALAGLGYALYQRNIYDVSGPPGRIVHSGSGSLVENAGLVARWRHVVVEQHVLAVPGGGQALNAPLMVGLRY